MSWVSSIISTAFIFVIAFSLIVSPIPLSSDFSVGKKDSKDVFTETKKLQNNLFAYLLLIPNVAFAQTDSTDQPSASFSLTVISGTSCSDPSPDPENVATGDDDIIYGTSNPDSINGLGGNDQLFGCNNKDTLDGGPGNDLLVGGNGKDTLTGGDGADTFDCGHGDDVVIDFDPSEGDTAVGCENATGVDNIPPNTTTLTATVPEWSWWYRP